MGELNIISRQKGVTMLLILVFMVGMFGIIGLAIDTGNLLLNKTRLQNAIDSAVMSAAITLNNDPSATMDVATTQGKATFNLFKQTSGNEKLADVSSDQLTFEYSVTLNPFTPIVVGSTEKPNFVRASTNALVVNPILVHVLSQTLNVPTNVSSVSTAGLKGAHCNLVPIVLCPANGVYEECDEYGCNGIDYNTRVCLKGGTEAAKGELCQDGTLPNGNFGLLRFDGMSGADDIKDLLAGTVDVCTNVATWENGNKVGPVSQGVESRFADDFITQEFFPDLPQGEGATDLYPQYLARYAEGEANYDNPNGKEYNRVVQIPIAKSCTTEGVEWDEIGCFFMSQEVIHTGTSNEIYGEVIEVCPGKGKAVSFHSTIVGPTKPVLYKSYKSQDS